MRRATCSCGRAEVEPGYDLCVYCRADHEERQYQRELEADQGEQYKPWDIAYNAFVALREHSGSGGER